MLQSRAVRPAARDLKFCGPRKELFKVLISKKYKCRIESIDLQKKFTPPVWMKFGINIALNI